MLKYQNLDKGIGRLFDKKYIWDSIWPKHINEMDPNSFHSFYT